MPRARPQKAARPKPTILRNGELSLDVERRILDLSGRLLEELEGLKVDIVTTKEERYRSGIVNFKVPEVDRVLEGLARRNIVVSKRTGGIRVSPHFFNVEDELQQLCRAVKELSE